MKFSISIILSVAMSCQLRKAQDRVEANEYSSEQSDTSVDLDHFVAPPENDWDYHVLYGVYLHESNSKGFTAILEIIPEGNDLTFSLSIKKQSCMGQSSGQIGMAIHSENEYAGFYESENCRMQFFFNLIDNSIRIQEVGICTQHEAGCSFEGTFRKNK